MQLKLMLYYAFEVCATWSYLNPHYSNYISLCIFCVQHTIYAKAD